MTVVGAHRINKGKMDVSICEAIAQTGALRPGDGTFYGAGVYAYYADHVPRDFLGDPFAVFEPIPHRGRINMLGIFSRGVSAPQGTSTPDRRFFLLPGEVGKPIKVAILGFVNCPGLPKYPGILYYV